MDRDTGPEPAASRGEVAEFLDTAPTDAIREAGRRTTGVLAPFDATPAWPKILHVDARASYYHLRVIGAGTA